MIDAPINETLPATGGTAAKISLGDTFGCSNYIVQARGDVDMLVSNLQAMTTYFTIKAGTAVSLDKVLAPGSDCFYAISGSDADTVELLAVRR